MEKNCSSSQFSLFIQRIVYSGNIKYKLQIEKSFLWSIEVEKTEGIYFIRDGDIPSNPMILLIALIALIGLIIGFPRSVHTCSQLGACC